MRVQYLPYGSDDKKAFTDEVLGPLKFDILADSAENNAVNTFLTQSVVCNAVGN